MSETLEGHSHASPRLPSRYVPIPACPRQPGPAAPGDALEDRRDRLVDPPVADEVTDCSNMEQLSIVLRYVVDPSDCCIKEYLVAFVECVSGISGNALADKMLSFIGTYGLNPTKLRGQAYDGAGNMSGKTNGAAAVIASQYPLVLYLHCASHCLNLAVVKSLDVTSVRNMIGVVNRVSICFSAHPKHQRKLEEAIENT